MEPAEKPALPGMPPPRPHARSKEVCMAAAPKVVEAVRSAGLLNGWSAEDVAALERDIAHSLGYGRDDGFQMALALDRAGYQGMNAEWVEALDSAAFYLRGAESAAVKVWVQNHHITPRFAVGDEVQYKWGWGCEIVRRTVVKVDAELGRYHLQAPDTPNAQELVPFEWCEPVTAPAESG